MSIESDEMVTLPRAWLVAYLENDGGSIEVNGERTSLWELLTNAVVEPPRRYAAEPEVVNLEAIRLNAERYDWIRLHAVRIQGSQIWYQGEALDIRVDIGREHMAKQAKLIQQNELLLSREAD